MKRYIEIDNKIQQGCLHILENQTAKGCDIWLDAWEDIKTLFSETGAKDIFELDRKYPWTEFISNYAQDLEMELHNAGVDDASYHQKRIKYCRELLNFCGKDTQIISNTRRAVGESYSQLGDTATSDRLFGEWLREDPDWGWGYIGWSDCYSMFKTSVRDYCKAEQILLQGLAHPELRDKVDVVDRIIWIYKQLYKPEKVHEYKKLYRELQGIAPKNSPHYRQMPVISEKIGRNEPCPCGSCKKYKKCCGA